jgi:hypothetical protein
MGIIDVIIVPARDRRGGVRDMGVGVSTLLVAVGAILAFAVNSNNVDTGGGVNLRTVGVILLVVGVLGVRLSIAYWSSWGGRGIGPRQHVLDVPPGPDGR